MQSWKQREELKNAWKDWSKVRRQEERKQEKRAKRKVAKLRRSKGEPVGLFGLQWRVCREFKITYRNRPPQHKIERLIALSKLKFASNQTYEQRRKKSHWVRSEWRCWICGEKAQVQHHILQVQNGGYDNGINRIGICNVCHAKLHSWMMDRVVQDLHTTMDKEVMEICKC